MNQIRDNVNSPWMSLLILLGLTFGCALGTQIIVIIVQLFFVGNLDQLADGGFESALAIDFENNPVYSYISVIVSSFGTFFLPAWFLQRLEPYHNYFVTNRQQQGLYFLLSVLFLFAFMPAMEFVGEMNLKMSLPESLRSIEEWMRVKEDSMAELTKNMVMVDSWSLLFVNLFAVAVMPAIAEEYFFRGSLMFNIQRMVKNHHLSIWITAIIFSAIHVQFFGFLPRMLLGAFFGYMLLWSKNIWVPILAHFVNNGIVVILAFYYTKQGKTYEDLQSIEGYTLIVYLGSIILSALIGWYFYKKSKEFNSNNGKGLD